MSFLVFVYPEKVREPFGAERYYVEWEQVRPSALQRNRMKEVYMRNQHVKKGHTGELIDCKVEGCEYWRFQDIDHDADIVTHFKVFRGTDAQAKAKAFAQKEVNKGNTAYGAVTVYKQVVDWYVEEDRVAEWVTVGDGEGFTAEMPAANTTTLAPCGSESTV